MANVKITDLTADTPASGDEIPIHDASGGDTNKITIADLAGNGLASGSPIDVGAGTAITVNANDVQVTSGGITTTELDLSIAPTWTGSHTFNADMTLGMVPNATYDLKGYNDSWTVEAQSSGQRSRFAMTTADQDGTDDLFWGMYALGNPSSTDREVLLAFYSSSDSRFEIVSNNRNTGSLRPVHIGANGAGTSQFVARTDGNVAMSGSLKVGGTGVPSAGQLEAVNNGDAFVVANTTDTTSGRSGLLLREGGSGRYDLLYEVSNARLKLQTFDSDGGGTNADVIRIPDGQLTVDFNATADDTAFDEYEDYKLARAARVSMMPDESELRKRHADLLREYRPVLEKSGMVKWDEDGTPFIGAQKMMMFQLDGLFQVGTQAVENRDEIQRLRNRVQQLEERVA